MSKAMVIAVLASLCHASPITCFGVEVQHCKVLVCSALHVSLVHACSRPIAITPCCCCVMAVCQALDLFQLVGGVAEEEKHHPDLHLEVRTELRCTHTRDTPAHTYIYLPTHKQQQLQPNTNACCSKGSVRKAGFTARAASTTCTADGIWSGEQFSDSIHHLITRGVAAWWKGMLHCNHAPHSVPSSAAAQWQGKVCSGVHADLCSWMLLLLAGCSRAGTP